MNTDESKLQGVNNSIDVMILHNMTRNGEMSVRGGISLIVYDEFTDKFEETFVDAIDNERPMPLSQPNMMFFDKSSLIMGNIFPQSGSFFDLENYKPNLDSKQSLTYQANMIMTTE